MDNRGVPDFNKRPGNGGGGGNDRPNQPRLSSGTSGRHLDASINYKSTDEVDIPSIEGYEIGDTIGGAYFIISQLGRGGMGLVFRVEHVMLRQEYALKILTGDAADTSSWRRFQTEARTIAKLNHPNIIKIHNLGIHNEQTPFYVMELLSGETLSAWVKREGPMSTSAVIDLFLPLCDGLAYAHSHGIVHRDIKPSNIMLVTQNNKIVPKLVDFGLVKLVGNALSPSQQLTNTGEVFGSPLYMSPEQSVGRHINERSDIYSLGCTMFEALTGAPPFVGENVVQTILKHQNEAPPTLKQASMGEEFSPEWEAVIARALEKEASDRYQSMAELSADLQALKAGKKLRRGYATDGGELFGDDTEDEEEEKKRALGKGKVLVISSVVLLLILSAAAGGYVYMQKRKPVEAAHVDPLSYSGIQSDKPVMVNRAETAEFEDIHTPFLKEDGQPGGVRTFKFPDNISIGSLKLESLDRGKMQLDAMGLQKVPPGMVITFDAGTECGVHPKIFRKFRNGDIQAVVMPGDGTDTDDSLHYINHLTDLSIVNLDGTDVTATGLKELAALPKLDQISLKGPKSLTGKDLATLPGLTNLKLLNFERGKDVGPLLKALKDSTKIQRLSLNDCPLTAEDIKIIATMRNLEALSITSCGVNSEAIKPLNDLPKLANLTMSGNEFTPDFIDIFKDNNHLAWMQISPPKWSEEDLARLKSTYGPRCNLRELAKREALE